MIKDDLEFHHAFIVFVVQRCSKIIHMKFHRALHGLFHARLTLGLFVQELEVPAEHHRVVHKVFTGTEFHRVHVHNGIGCKGA